jgi:hypothetical protein
MKGVHKAVLSIAGVKDNDTGRTGDSEWKIDPLKVKKAAGMGAATARRRGDVGDGGMYI